MRQTKEILRQKWLLARSHRAVAESVGVSAGIVGETLRRARAAGLSTFSEVEDLAPTVLEARLYPSAATSQRPTPDCAWIHRERRRIGVTLELLHLEYIERHPDGYGYTQLCEHYRQWLGRREISMHQVHVAGDKTFVDYSGKKPCIWDAKTGERIEVELFVAVLGASNLTFAEATRTQSGPDWIASHTNAVAYFGGSSAVYVSYHVEPDGHYYSVPYQHRGDDVELRFGAATAEVLLDGERIAAHARSYQRGRHTTVAEHMPVAHRQHTEWSPSRLINWAATIGLQTRALVEAILADRPHPEQGYRSCLGLLRLGKRYGHARLEAACARALTARARSYRHAATSNRC